LRIACGARRTQPVDPPPAAELADPAYVNPLLIHIAEQPAGRPTGLLPGASLVARRPIHPLCR